MILACNQCQTKFTISSAALGPTGRRVRCSSCGYEWFQLAEQEAHQHSQDLPISELKSTARSVPSEPNDPYEAYDKKHARVKVPFYQSFMWRFLLKTTSIIAVMVMLFIAIITYGIELGKVWPYCKPILNMLHIYDTQDIKFALVDCTLKSSQEDEEESNTVELNVKVVIKNAAEEDKKLDVVRFSIYTKKKDFLGEYTMSLDKVIPAKKEETIEGILNRVPKDVTFVIVEMGNAVEIMIRDQSHILNYQDNFHKSPHRS